LDLPGLHDSWDNLLSLFKKPSLIPQYVPGKAVYALLSDEELEQKGAGGTISESGFLDHGQVFLRHG
jgi:hypothetical protein